MEDFTSEVLEELLESFLIDVVTSLLFIGGSGCIEDLFAFLYVTHTLVSEGVGVLAVVH